MQILVPVGAGDLIDRITILKIKLEKIPQGPARQVVRKELQHLRDVRKRHAELNTAKVRAQETQLAKFNAQLWRIEDRLRVLEAAGDFGAGFVRLARSVYRTNDKRAKTKRAINDETKSALREEKWFSVDGGKPAKPARRRAG